MYIFIDYYYVTKHPDNIHMLELCIVLTLLFCHTICYIAIIFITCDVSPKGCCWRVVFSVFLSLNLFIKY